jgi:hypothetical protein
MGEERFYLSVCCEPPVTASLVSEKPIAVIMGPSVAMRGGIAFKSGRVE